MVNVLPLERWNGFGWPAIASPASPLYPATVSTYFESSSLMENVEYSVEYHRPEG